MIRRRRRPCLVRCRDGASTLTAGSGWSRFARRMPVTTVQQVAQGEEDRAAPIISTRWLTARTEITDHVHVDALAALVDLGPHGRTPARYAPHERRRLGNDVLRRVQKARIERVLIWDSSHHRCRDLDDLELAGVNAPPRSGSRWRRPGLANAGDALSSTTQSCSRKVSRTISADSVAFAPSGNRRWDRAPRRAQAFTSCQYRGPCNGCRSDRVAQAMP